MNKLVILKNKSDYLHELTPIKCFVNNKEFSINFKENVFEMPFPKGKYELYFKSNWMKSDRLYFEIEEKDVVVLFEYFFSINKRRFFYSIFISIYFTFIIPFLWAKMNSTLILLNILLSMPTLFWSIKFLLHLTIFKKSFFKVRLN